MEPVNLETLEMACVTADAPYAKLIRQMNQSCRDIG